MNKVIRIAVMMGLVLSGFASAADEVLYWMLDNPTITDWYNTQYQLADRSTTVKGNEMVLARVAAVSADQVADYNATRLNDGIKEGDLVYLDLYYESGSSWVIDNPTGQGRDAVAITTGGKVEPYQRASIAASLSTKIPDVDWTTYSFAVELGTFNDNGDWVLAAISGTETYEALTDYISEQLDIPTVTRWSPDAFAAPEPTSGLLTLIGLALLGLKRKKVVACQNRGRDETSRPRLSVVGLIRGEAMKKNLIASVIGLAAFGVCAAEGDCVYSSNAHAIVKVETFSTNVLIAVPWTFYTPTGTSDTNLPINRLVKPEGLDDGDMLLSVTQTNPQKYKSWMLTKDANGIGTWEPAISVDKSNADLKARLVQGKGQVSFDAGAEDPVSRGIGLWLVRTNPKDGEGNWKPVYLYGQWTKASASVTVKGGAGVTNAVMIAYPACTKAVKINEDMTWDFVGAKDTLSIPNGGDAWNMAVWNPSEGKWGTEKVTEEVKTYGTRKVIVQTSSWDYDITVPAGCGFWYIRRDVAGDCTISWPE